MVFAPEDSGTPAAPVIYRAHKHEKPIISGGVRLSGWKVDKRGAWTTRIPRAKRGDWTFSQLFVNGERRSRPRLPATGYYTVAEELPPANPPEAPIGPKGADRFVFNFGEFSSDWKNTGEVEVVALHIWSASRLRVKAVDETNRVVSFTGPTYDPTWLPLKQGIRYSIENVAEALENPGEWYLDRATGTLTYIPRPGETPDSAEVIAPCLYRIVELRGDEVDHRLVEHITFQGITFAHSNYTVGPRGQSIGQAECILGGAIRGVGAFACTLEGCAVTHVGSYAIEWGDGCRGNRVENCHLSDLGAGGVKIGRQQLYGYDADEAASHNAVVGCRIEHGGRIHPGGVGILILSSPHNTIEGNEVFDFYYTGISVGLWGGRSYPATWAHHNTISGNHVHRIGQGVLSDMAGIYTMGSAPGTTVSGNLVHDVSGHDYGGIGIYIDEGGVGITVANNICYDTSSQNFLQNYGRENTIRNNIFVLGGNGGVAVNSIVDGKAFVFERNIVVVDGQPVFSGALTDERGRKGLDSDNNLFWDLAGREPTFGNGSWAQWKEQGQDTHSILADPMFVDLKKRDFRLRPGSPSEKIGMNTNR